MGKEGKKGGREGGNTKSCSFVRLLIFLPLILIHAPCIYICMIEYPSLLEMSAVRSFFNLQVREGGREGGREGMQERLQSKPTSPKRHPSPPPLQLLLPPSLPPSSPPARVSLTWRRRKPITERTWGPGRARPSGQQKHSHSGEEGGREGWTFSLRSVSYKLSPPSFLPSLPPSPPSLPHQFLGRAHQQQDQEALPFL